MSTSPSTILVAGASGFVGRRLVPALEAAGHQVRAMTRRPDRYRGAGTPVQAEVMDPDALHEALWGCSVAYYLVHSLNHGDFVRRDAEAAEAFGLAAAGAGVERIVYLGGLGDADDNLSPHLRSRQEVEELLQVGGVPVTSLRAGIVVGHGGASWEMIRNLVERIPALPVPQWGNTRTQPIALSDVVRYLVGVLVIDDRSSHTFDVGGSEVLRYRDMLSRVSAMEGRPAILVPILFPSTRLAALLASQALPLITGVDGRTIRSLIGSMKNDVVVRDDSIRRIVDFEPMDYDAAVLEALGERGPLPTPGLVSAPRLAPSSVLPSWTEPFLEAARQAGDDVPAGLDVARAFGRRLPQPGSGRTAVRWHLLAEAARADLSVARILEAHSDALAILGEAGEELPDGTWGVFAAAMPGVTLNAVAEHDGTTVLVGTKPWCSLGAVLDHALVTARSGGSSGLYAVSLQQPSVTADDASRWVARGLSHITSAAVHFDRSPARAVGEDDWYLCRPGFAWGGMGVAACWFGGAVGLYDSLRRSVTKRPGALSDLHVGTVDVALHGAAAALAQAAELVDSGAANGPAGERLALRVRSVVADAAERTLRQVGHALGPAPLAFDEIHARRVADLELYVRQHHAERDLATLGAALNSTGSAG